ncbi:MAG: hypothetical protein IJU93_10515 [Lachnospiraceae bacterium]|nr:hypothetical protein [Lachnospiraceae bacterium]
MEYVFGEVKRNGIVYDAVKTKDRMHSDLAGTCQVKRSFDNAVIYDRFSIVEKYWSQEDEEGNCYDSYVIKDHYRYEDKFTPGIVPTEQEITDQEIAVMEAEQLITDLDIRVMELELR